jgi:hypothetical protein
MSWIEDSAKAASEEFKRTSDEAFTTNAELLRKLAE